MSNAGNPGLIARVPHETASSAAPSWSADSVDTHRHLSRCRDRPEAPHDQSCQEGCQRSKTCRAELAASSLPLSAPSEAENRPLKDLRQTAPRLRQPGMVRPRQSQPAEHPAGGPERRPTARYPGSLLR